MLEYLDTGKLQDELRMTPKNAGLNHRGPSINDVCTLPCPNVKFSTQTLSSRKRSSNLHLLCSQSPAKKVKNLINFFGGGKADGQNLHTEPAKITEEGTNFNPKAKSEPRLRLPFDLRKTETL